MDAKVPMKLVDNGFTINVCPIRTALKVGLDIEKIIPSLLTSKAYDNTSRKVMGTFKATCKIGPTKFDCGISCNGHYFKLQTSTRKGMASSHRGYPFYLAPKDEDSLEWSSCNDTW